jgi:hypothetical protein
MTNVKTGGRITVHETNVHREVIREAQCLHDRWDRWQRLPSLLVLEDRINKATLSKALARELDGING